MKYNTPKPMGYNTSNAESEVYSYKLVYLKRPQDKNLTLDLEELKKKRINTKLTKERK